MFFSEKKRHRQPRSLSFGNCGWEGPLWLVRQSGQSDSPFPESQAGTRRLKEERHQAELDCLLLWTVRQGGRLNCFAAVHFFPFSLPCLLSLLPADSGGSLCSSPWKPPQLEGRVSEVCGLIFISLDTLSSSPAANGNRKETIKEKIGVTWWFVFFLGYLVVSESFWDRAQGSTRQVARVASYQERQQSVILASYLSRQTGRAFERAPCDVALPAAGFTRHLGFALPKLLLHSQSSPSLLPGSVTVSWGWFGDGKRASTLKWSCHDYSRQSSFEPWRTLRVLQPSKTAQARLADLHVSHNPKLSEPHVCSGNKVCFLNCSCSWI